MRTIGILSALLGAALVGSYLTWTAEDTGDDTTKIPVFQAAVDDLQKITWKEESLTAVLERKSDGGGTYTWVTLTETTEVEVEPEPAAAEGPAPAEDDGTADAPPPAEKVTRTETQTTAFKGNTAADEVWAGFAPFLALRELEGGASRAEIFGLANPSATLEVVRKSGPLNLAIGGESYGAKDRYVGLDGKVFLVDEAVLRPLKTAKTRLIDRSVQPFDEPAARTVTIQANGATTRFEQRNADDRAKAFWAKAGSDAADEAGASWLGKLFRFRIQRFVTEADVAGPLEPRFTVAVSDGKDSYTVEVLQAGPAWFARSTWSRGLVELAESPIGDAYADLDTVLGE